MNKDKLSKQQIDDIIAKLDETISDGVWEESNFLRMTGKKLKSIRDEFVAFARGVEEKPTELQIKQEQDRVSQKQVFILLYATEGNKLSAWERIIANLPRQLISRPIYAKELDVNFAIKSRARGDSDAYLVAYMPDSAIINLPEEKVARDRRGKQLMTLRDRSLDLDNIIRFVHRTGTYHYKNGRLILETNSDDQ